MRIFILAAGTGSRLYPLTKHVPKSLLDIGDGNCLLGEQLKAITETGLISEAVIITGYRSEQIERWLEQQHHGVAVCVIYNPFYASSNNLASLWCARHLMNDKDFIVTNGDNLYQHGTLGAAVRNSAANGVTLTLSRKNHFDDDDMKVALKSDGTLQQVGKRLSPSTTHAESVGLAFVRGKASRRDFVATLETLLRDPENLGNFWLEAFNALVLQEKTVEVVDIPADHWAEVDFHPDIETVRARLTAEVRKIS